MKTKTQTTKLRHNSLNKNVFYTYAKVRFLILTLHTHRKHMMSSTNASPFEFTLQPMEGSEPGVLTPLQAVGSTLSDSLLSLALGEKIQSPNKVLATKENYTTLAVGMPELVSTGSIFVKRRLSNRLLLRVMKLHKL